MGLGTKNRQKQRSIGNDGNNGCQEPRGPVARGGKAAELPLVEQPCPSCTWVVAGLEGAAFHLADRLNLVVIPKTSPDRLGPYAQERGWRNLRLLSSRNNIFNRD